MRRLSETEMISLRELLQMETNALGKLKATKAMITDNDLLRHVESGILSGEGRIKGIQQFITENNILNNTREER